MNKREKLFVLAYTDTTTPKTYENATQSALRAGYSQRNAASQGCKLLKKQTVKQEITNISKISEEKYALNKETAIIEARRNYESASGHNERKYWYDMWVNLQGWLIQKFESKSENTVIQKDSEKEEIQDCIRQFTQIN